MTSTGTAFSTTIQTVYVHGGPRGPQGLQGEAGPEGPQGTSINVRGTWASGQTYCPGDAVTYRSSILDEVDSLYIQKSTIPCGASGTPPHLDTSRWDEVGAVSFGNAFGGIWEVYQVDHGFQYVGTPVAFDFATASYVSADADAVGDLAVAVVREVVDTNRVILQSTGEVPYIDSRVIWPDGSSWVPGKIYYVSSVRGRVVDAPPETMGSWSNPILMATDAPAPGARNGVALPWSPAAEDPTPVRVLVGFNKFYYDAGVAQVDYSGPDRYGNTLSYVAGEASNEVFVAGANQDPADFTMADGSTVTLSAAPAPGDVVEIWAAAQPTAFVVPSTVQKLDDISDDFDGATDTFPLTVASSPVLTLDATNAQIVLDAFPQEPGVDYTLIPDPVTPTNVAIQFSVPIPAGTRFFGWLYEPYADPGIAPTSFLSLTDTPVGYGTAASKSVKVNPGETGLEFVFETFALLADTPASYATAAGYVVTVNGGETGLEFTEFALSNLTDVPALAGNANLLLSVNGTGTGVVWRAPTFLEGSDVPASYAGAAGYAVVVNGLENALEFADLSGLYLPVDGSGAMTGALDMGGFDVNAVGTVQFLTGATPATITFGTEVEVATDGLLSATIMADPTSTPTLPSHLVTKAAADNLYYDQTYIDAADNALGVLITASAGDITAIDGRVTVNEGAIDTLSDVVVRLFEDLPDLLADTSALTPGDVVTTRLEGYRYLVSAVPSDLTTAGGDHLTVLPDADGFRRLDAYNPNGDGLTDDSATFLKATTAGPVRLTAGTSYVLTPEVTMVDNCTLHGEGTLILTGGIVIGDTVPEVEIVGVNFQNADNVGVKTLTTYSPGPTRVDIRDTVVTGGGYGFWFIGGASNVNVTRNRFESLRRTDGGQLHCITVGTNDYTKSLTNTHIHIHNNIAKDLRNTGVSETHFCIVYGYEVTIASNTVDGVSNSDGQACEAIYTKAVNFAVTGNTIKDCESLNDGAITIKGENDGVVTFPQGHEGVVTGNSVIWTLDETSDVRGIACRVNDCEVSGNSLKNCRMEITGDRMSCDGNNVIIQTDGRNAHALTVEAGAPITVRGGNYQVVGSNYNGADGAAILIGGVGDVEVDICTSAYVSWDATQVTADQAAILVDAGASNATVYLQGAYLTAYSAGLDNYQTIGLFVKSAGQFRGGVTGCTFRYSYPVVIADGVSISVWTDVRNNSCRPITRSDSHVLRDNWDMFVNGSLMTSTRNYTMAAARPGQRVTFHNPNSTYNLRAKAAVGETFNSTGTDNRLLSPGATLVVECSTAGVWHEVAEYGTVT